MKLFLYSIQTEQFQLDISNYTLSVESRLFIAQSDRTKGTLQISHCDTS